MTFKELQKYCYDSSDSKYVTKLIHQEGRVTYIKWTAYGEVLMMSTILSPDLVTKLTVEKAEAIKECYLEGLHRVMKEYSDCIIDESMWEGW